jgi:hypothetical protein
MGLAMLLPAALLGVIGIIFALARVDGKNSAA